jgi:predicted RNA-binding Zn-ribbon protein involved in translation (DUF1610 family)
MRCSKNGFMLQYEGGGVVSGDKYQCPDCGDEIVIPSARSCWSDSKPDLVVKNDFK